MTLDEMTPTNLTKVSDDELRLAWLRLNQWYSNAKKQGKAIEPFVNAAVFVIEEMEKRGFNIDKDLPLYQEALRLKSLLSLPEDIVIVPDFVNIVGSSVNNLDKAHDIDILFRAEHQGKNFLVPAESVYIQLRKLLDPAKKRLLHFIDAPYGPHDDYIPLYDLVLRRKKVFERKVIKGQPIKLDLGCGHNKPKGYIGIDKDENSDADIIWDLENGIPYPDESVDEVRAYHILEHLSDKEKIMAEIWRVLKPGGRLVFEVPSTKGEGAFNHPDHKSFWNKSTFYFWTQDHLLEGRPKFELEELEEINRGDFVYVRGVLRKPKKVNKAGLEPFKKFIPPKPKMAGYTEAFSVEDLLKWAEGKYPIAIEPKYNGFRCVAEKKGNKVRLWFEGQYGKDQLYKFPEIKKALENLSSDFILDCDLGLLVDGKRAPRPALMKFNRENPEFAPNEKPILTVFDVPYWNRDMSNRPFSERRKLLEIIKFKDPVKISLIKWCNSPEEVEKAAKWAFDQDRSEGLVAKVGDSIYETDGDTNDWFKLKKVVELKVIVLDKQTTKAGAYNYWGGLLLSPDMDWENVTELNGKKYVNLGKTFSTKVEANVGDIITCQVLEIIPDEEKKRLTWLGARVIDVDPTRKEPYTTRQVIRIAREAGILQKSLDIVQGRGPKNPLVAIIGDFPTFSEIVQKKAFVGRKRELVKKYLLEPLGLSESEVYFINAVPVAKTNEPDINILLKWREWLINQLEDTQPPLSISIGKAKYVVGDRVDAILPDLNEVDKFKLKYIKTLIDIKAKLDKIRKAELKDEGDTRAELAEKFWAENWHLMYPSSGKGRFVYHHHWRGLSEEEAKLSEEELLRTNHSLHGDLRFEADKGLWGFSVFLGTTEANRKAGGDRLINLPPDDNLMGQFKLAQPKAWLEVGIKEPLVTPPGGVGATSKKYAKFFAIDHGWYEMGVWREHMFEIFLHGNKLKGRFIIEYAPVGDGKRVWLIDKPKDQTPYADKHDLEEVIEELRKKGQRWLIWAKPGMKPIKIDVQKNKVVKHYYCDIIKSEEKQIVYGVVLEPDTVDAQGDIIPPEEIENAAHEFMLISQTIGIEHSAPAEAKVVESYIAPTDLEIGGQKVKKGSWIIAVKIFDKELWEKIKKGYYTGFSIGGYATREKVGED